MYGNGLVMFQDHMSFHFAMPLQFEVMHVHQTQDQMVMIHSNYYLDPTDNVTWLGGVGKAMTCKGTQTLPNITGWSGVCYVNPQVPNDCPTRPRPAERLVSIWQPGFDNETGAEILSGIVAHPNTFNAISNTWAYWNSEWNPKCNNSYHGLCFEEFSNDMWPILKELNESYNVNILPIIETCCVCVLNASYDFTPAMTRLVQDSLTYGFAGDKQKTGVW